MDAVQTKEKAPVLQRVAADTVAAGVASLLVSPFITVIDRSLIETASAGNKKVSLKEGIKNSYRAFFKSGKPVHHFFLRNKAFHWVFGLYFATYATANYIDTACDTAASFDPKSFAEESSQAAGEASRTRFWSKFIGTSAVNVSLCILKDREFTRMFGNGPPKPLPLITYGLFASRDSMTNIASFCFPSLMSKQIQRNFNIEESQPGALPVEVEKRKQQVATADKAAQLLSPSLMQIASTPLHLLGIAFYNASGAPTAASTASSANAFSLQAFRKSPFVTLMKKEYFNSLALRLGRIAPAFGLGGVSNTFVRETMSSSEWILPASSLAVAAGGLKERLVGATERFSLSAQQTGRWIQRGGFIIRTVAAQSRTDVEGQGGAFQRLKKTISSSFSSATPSLPSQECKAENEPKPNASSSSSSVVLVWS